MSEVRENTALEELKGFLPKPEEVILPSHAKLRDLLDQLYLLRNGPGLLDRYYAKAWLETLRGDIEARMGETLEALYGRLTFIDVAAILSSKPAEDAWVNYQIEAHYAEWKKATGVTSKLYSALGEYGATGEGQTYNLVTGGASSEAEFLVKVVQKIGAWFTIGVDIYEGLPPEGGVADLLITPAFRKLAERLGPHLEHQSSIHYNLS